MGRKLFCTLLCGLLSITQILSPGNISGDTDAAAFVPADPDACVILMVNPLEGLEAGTYTQSAWEGVEAYCQQEKKQYAVWEVEGNAVSDCTQAIRSAIAGGGKVIVCPGYPFGEAVTQLQAVYPEVAFLLLNDTPDVAGFNTAGVLFREEEASYLAGYGAVKDGYTRFGYMASADIPVYIRYGGGFLQGANDAAKELGITVEMRYHLSLGYGDTAECREEAESWYLDGIQVIYSCGGGPPVSTVAAAQNVGGKVVGVDIDMSQCPEYSGTQVFLTSAVLDLSEATRQLLDAYYAGSFPGGQTLRLGIESGAVKLPMDTSLWQQFTQEDYELVCRRLAEESVVVKTGPSLPELGCENVRLIAPAP